MRSEPVIFTTFAANQVGDYAGAMVESVLANWPHRLICYTDSTQLPRHDKLDVVGLPHLMEIPDKPGSGTDWRYDVHRFLWKASAIVQIVQAAVHQHVIWLDADCFAFDKIPRDIADQALESEGFAYIGRQGGYPETGFLAFDTTHAAAQQLIVAYKEIYESGAVYDIKEGWTDIHVLQMAIEITGLAGRNLTPGAKAWEHAWMRVPLLANCLDHMKGPRKAQGFSKEHPLQKGRWKTT